MSASVVGFDIGNATSYIAIAKRGGIETIDNEYSDRCTPTYVSYNDKTRIVGVAAKQSAVTNVKNTIYNFCRFIGKNYSDPVVQKEIPHLPFKIISLPGDKIGFEVKYLGETQVYTPEQVLSAQLSKLKQITETHAGAAIFDVVINCPSFFSDSERWAIIDAARVSGLNCVRLINDTTAIGIAYGLYNQDLPDQDKPARNVVFVLMGQSNLQVAICALNKGKMKMLSTAAEPCLGGRDFDMAIYNRMADEFKDKYKLNVRSNAKATLKLNIECEKLKKLMSANSTAIPLNIECFMEDKDVSSNMKREEFESLIQPLLQTAEETMKRCLDQAELTPQDITFVELIGGSTRVPSIKALVSKVFGQEGRTTLNADEAVARGCALQSAIISPAFKVREFSITDACPYSVTIRYPSFKKPGETETFEIFPHLHPIPLTRQISIKQKEDFEIEAFYTDDKVWNNNKKIGTFKICNVRPQAENQDIEVKIKIRVGGNGTLSISSAQLVEKHEKEEIVQPMEIDKEEPAAEGEKKESTDCENNGTVTEEDKKMDAEPAPAPTGEPKKVKKIVNKFIDIPIEGINTHMSDAEIQSLLEIENNIISQDRLQKEKDNAKNALEEYIYEMRDKVSGSYADFIPEADCENFSAKLTKMEDWLYDEGEDVSRQIYADKLEELKSVGNIYYTRHWEAENRPGAINHFNQVFNNLCTIVDSHSKGEEKYDHITKEDMAKVSEILKEKRKWLDDGISQQNAKKKTEDPVLFTRQIMDSVNAIENICIPIVNKPKPAPPKVETKEAEKPTNGDAPKADQKTENDGPAEKNGAEPEMDVD